MIKLEEYIKFSYEERTKHLDLNEDCIERGTISTHCRGILASFLNTTVNVGIKPWVDLCHKCNNPSCSNTKHMYWGTRSENMKDLIETGYKPIGMKGLKNPNYKLSPWRNIQTKNLHVIKSWILVKKIYDEYISTNWDFKKYGNGYTKFCIEFGIAQGTSRTMIRMFKNKWNPNEDKDYMDFYNKNKDIIS